MLGSQVEQANDLERGWGEESLFDTLQVESRRLDKSWPRVVSFVWRCDLRPATCEPVRMHPLGIVDYDWSVYSAAFFREVGSRCAACAMIILR